MSAYASEILVIVISAIGLLGIVAFLIWLSPFSFRRTAICVFGGMVILAGIVWVIQNAEFAIAESANQFHVFGGIRHYDWYTFPMLNNWEIVLMYAAIIITVTAPVYAIVRQVMRFLRRK